MLANLHKLSYSSLNFYFLIFASKLILFYRKTCFIFSFYFFLLKVLMKMFVQIDTRKALTASYIGTHTQGNAP